MQHYLFLDIETRSSEPLAKSGVYRYSESDDFEVLLISYALDDMPVGTIDLASGDELRTEFIDMIKSGDVMLVAHNSAFERVCLSRLFGGRTGEYLPPESWLDTMVMAQYLALPCSLREAGKILNISHAKMEEGKGLVSHFCNPRADGKFNLPEDDPIKWQTFVTYNAVDVEAEREIFKKLYRFMPPQSVWDDFYRSERINDNGIAVDLELVKGAVYCNEMTLGSAVEKMREITGLQNPNSPVQLKRWLAERGVVTDSVDKAAVQSILKTAPEDVCNVLRLRQQTAKSSLAKYGALLDAVSDDGRIRGNFRFYGAVRTGRFTGTRVALQCLPRNSMPELDRARTLVKEKRVEQLELEFGFVQPVLSELIRTCFIPEEGKKLIVADFSAIEARVISALSGENWRLGAFSAGRDVYCETASRMFGIPVEKHGVNSEYRAIGKVAELALGYNGGRNALLRMGADRLNLSDEQLDDIVIKWRAANPKIVALWKDAEEAARTAISYRSRQKTHGIEFSYESGFLFLKLPSGRRLAYPKAHISTDDEGREVIAFSGTAKGAGLIPETTFGGKLTENLTQSYARDLLCSAIENVEKMLGNSGKIVMHVHDEIIVECCDNVTVTDVIDAMCTQPDWAPTIPLNADGFECDYYRKD